MLALAEEHHITLIDRADPSKYRGDSIRVDWNQCTDEILL